MDMVREIFFYAFIGYAIYLTSKLIALIIVVLILCFLHVFLPLLAAIAFMLVLQLGSELLLREIRRIRRVRKRDSGQLRSYFVRQKWSFVARLVSWDGFDHWPFYAVDLVDMELVDDPMFPNVSLVYFVELRMRHPMWHTITIWRLSLLSGNRMHVCDFDFFDWFADHELRHFTACPYQSRAVIFVYFRHHPAVGCWSSTRRKWLYVYDIRYEVRAKFEIWKLWRLGRAVYPVVIKCIRRWMENGRVKGWRVRLVEDCDTSYDHEWRWSMSDTVVDLFIENRKIELVSCEDVILLRWSSLPLGTHIRDIRSQKKFGRYVKRIDDDDAAEEKPTYVYDTTTNTFQLYRTLDDFLRSDASLLEFENRRHRSNIARVPPVLTDRECVSMVDRVVIKTDFAPLPLRMASARSVFTAIPAAKEMRASQFRKAIGLDLTGHFDA